MVTTSREGKPQAEGMPARPVSYYAGEIRRALPADVDIFAPARSRLLWLPLHLAIITLSTIAIATGFGGWPIMVLLSLVIGLGFGGITFLAHETLHGAVVRTGWLRHLVGWIGFAPFLVSPRLWVAWHNRAHHGNTMHAKVDPDAYPTLDEYRASGRVRFFVDHLALGHKHWAGAMSLLTGFTFQSAFLLVTSRERGYLSRREHKLAILETGLAVAMWLTVALLVGLVPFLFVWVIPLMVANAVVMGHILTNHSLSPLGDVNDPLRNSLSVTLPRWIEHYTLGFGLHVEHHIFPAMSTRHGRQVREVLRARWPERYQSMPLFRALRLLARTGRVYLDETTLYDPRAGKQWPTLGAGAPLVTPPVGEVAAAPERAPAAVPALGGVAP